MRAAKQDLGILGLDDAVLIGRGGFSRVYRARQAQFARDVAVKILDLDFVDERAQRRFVRECQATGRLADHPNIVSVYDAAVNVDGNPYILMEFCSKGSLLSRLSSEGPLRDEVVRDVGQKMASALSAAHIVGILHRDIKPANILVTNYGQPSLADFGIATSLDSSRSVGTEALTVDYAPPEVLEGADPDARSDLYSLGVTMYSLLTGRAPYSTDQRAPLGQQLLRILRDPVPIVSTPGVSAELRDVVRELMDKDPSLRPATADELAERMASLAVLSLPTTRATTLDAPTVLRVAALPSGKVSDAVIESSSVPPDEVTPLVQEAAEDVLAPVALAIPSDPGDMTRNLPAERRLGGGATTEPATIARSSNQNVTSSSPEGTTVLRPTKPASPADLLGYNSALSAAAEQTGEGEIPSFRLSAWLLLGVFTLVSATMAVATSINHASATRIGFGLSAFITTVALAYVSRGRTRAALVRAFAAGVLASASPILLTSFMNGKYVPAPTIYTALYTDYYYNFIGGGELLVAVAFSSICLLQRRACAGPLIGLILGIILMAFADIFQDTQSGGNVGASGFVLLPLIFLAFPSVGGYLGLRWSRRASVTGRIYVPRAGMILLAGGVVCLVFGIIASSLMLIYAALVLLVAGLLAFASKKF